MLEIINNKPVITADVCVLEEQDEHLVVAIRVPRASIEANKDFLAYIGDVSGDRPAKPLGSPLVRSFVRNASGARNWLAVASIAFLSILIWELGETNLLPVAIAENGTPFVWGSARFVQDTIPEGGELEIIASHKFLKPCDWSMTRRWYQGDHLIATTKVILPAIKADPEFATQKWPIELPQGLRSGDYDFKATLHGVCQHELFNQEIFEQNFHVVPRHNT